MHSAAQEKEIVILVPGETKNGRHYSGRVVDDFLNNMKDGKAYFADIKRKSFLKHLKTEEILPCSKVKIAARIDNLRYTEEGLVGTVSLNESGNIFSSAMEYRGVKAVIVPTITAQFDHIAGTRVATKIIDIEFSLCAAGPNPFAPAYHAN